jgi:hypothetical protein
MVSLAVHNSSKFLWRSILIQLSEYNRERFAVPAGACTAADFTKAMLKDEGGDFHLIIDEVDVLLEYGSLELVAEFLNTLRTLKQSPTVNKVHGVALLGTHKLRNLMVSRTLSFSPFSAESVLERPRFVHSDLVALLMQFATLHNIGGDLDAVASSIMAWTTGHVGLSGSCLRLLEAHVCTGKNGEDIDVAAWESFADQKLAEYVWENAVFRTIAHQLGVLATDSPVLPVLKTVLIAGSCENVAKELATELLALGLVVEIGANRAPTSTSGTALTAPSPLTRALLLQKMRAPSIPGVVPRRDSKTTDIDDLELLSLAVSSMSAANIVAPAALNGTGHPSEYAYQFEFLAQCSACLLGWFPLEHFCFIPEAKAEDASGQRRRRLDLFIYNGVRFGFELLASSKPAEIVEHFDRSKYYALTHELDRMLVLHFTTSMDHVATFPRDSIEIDVAGDGKKNCSVSVVHIVHDAKFSTAELFHDRQGRAPIKVDIAPRTWSFGFIKSG